MVIYADSSLGLLPFASTVCHCLIEKPCQWGGLPIRRAFAWQGKMRPKLAFQLFSLNFSKEKRSKVFRCSLKFLENMETFKIV